MTSNSLTENEQHGIPSQILKNIFGLHASVVIDPNVCRKSSGQLAELIVYIILYCHQILLQLVPIGPTVYKSALA